MKRWIASFGLAILTALTGRVSVASTYYLSDCKTGAVAECISGSNTAGAGTAINPWQTSTKLPPLVAGDHVRFARGGSWSFLGPFWPAFGSAKDNVYYEDYQAAWCLSNICLTQKPILNAALNADLIQLSNGGASIHKEGLTIRNLYIRAGAGSTSANSMGIFIYNDSDYITIDNISISGFGIGINLQSNSGIGPNSDGINQYITIKNSDIYGNIGMGIIGQATDLLIENNIVDRNGSHNAFDHNIYIGSAATLPEQIGRRITIRGNTLRRAAAGDGACHGAQLVFHGTVDNALIENNTIDGSEGVDPQCYGIQIDTADAGPEELSNITLRGNRIIDVGGNGISMAGCVNCTIENNLIIWEKGAIDQVGIAIPDTSPGPGDATQDKVAVINNSVYFAQATADTKGIVLNTYGANHKVVSNLIYFGSSSDARSTCFNPGPLPMFDAFDNNLCYHAGPGGVWSAAYPSLAAGRRAGFDLHGLNVDPLLTALPSAANGFNMALKPGSPAMGAGNRTLSAATDITGSARGPAPDIGAWQQGSAASAVPPAAPVGVVIQ